MGDWVFDKTNGDVIDRIINKFKSLLKIFHLWQIDQDFKVIELFSLTGSKLKDYSSVTHNLYVISLQA